MFYNNHHHLHQQSVFFNTTLCNTKEQPHPSHCYMYPLFILGTYIVVDISSLVLPQQQSKRKGNNVESNPPVHFHYCLLPTHLHLFSLLLQGRDGLCILVQGLQRRLKRFTQPFHVVLFLATLLVLSFSTRPLRTPGGGSLVHQCIVLVVHLFDRRQVCLLQCKHRLVQPGKKEGE